MAKPKTAPTLNLYFNSTKHPPEILRYETTAMTRELRALLQVVTAARRIARLAEHAHSTGDQVCGAEWSVVYALRRLDRVSGRQRKGGRP